MAHSICVGRSYQLTFVPVTTARVAYATLHALAYHPITIACTYVIFVNAINHFNGRNIPGV